MIQYLLNRVKCYMNEKLCLRFYAMKKLDIETSKTSFIASNWKYERTFG